MKKLLIIVKIYIAYFLYVFSKINIFSRKDIWIIGAKCGEGFDDNGAAFYRYLEKKRVENIYFVAKEEYIEFQNQVNYLKMYSIKSYYLFFKCKYTLFTHTLHSDIAPYVPFLPIVKMKDKAVNSCNLMHGVTALKKAEINLSYSKKDNDRIQKMIGNYNYVLVCCEREGRFIYESSPYYKKHQMVITEFPRFDQYLNNPEVNSENIILFSPTWRKWIKSKEDFENSAYKELVISIIGSDKLKKVLADNGYKMIFLPHMFISEYIELSDYLCDEIQVMSGSMSVDVLLRKSKMLVTDFSSILWDALYMNKPVIQLTHDLDRYLDEIGSYIDMDELKSIQSNNVSDTIEKIENIIKAQYSEDTFEVTDIDLKEYFEYKDGRASERVYQLMTRKHFD